jgi:hypothetical protein
MGRPLLARAPLTIQRIESASRRSGLTTVGT